VCGAASSGGGSDDSSDPGVVGIVLMVL